jgi:calcium-dependent protein kinase
MGIVHRDIKLENILYENHSKNSTVRLIDFGLSRTFDRRSTAADYTRTPYTISPETAKILQSSKNAKASDEVMTDKKDVWAVGVVAFLLLSGEFPFIKSNSDLKDPDKMDLLKRVSVLLLVYARCRRVIFWPSLILRPHVI